MSWASKLTARRALLAKAQRSVAYWGRRGGSVHGRAMLEEARAHLALRQRQVAEAEDHLAVSSMSPAGVALVAGFEGFSAKPYQDVVGVWTIGYGETLGVTKNTPYWTRAHAVSRLRERLNRDYLKPVLKVAQAAGLHLTQGQADALGSLVYNLGPGILTSGHTMGDALRSKNRMRIADAFLIYDKAGGHSLPGLTRRRSAERAMYLKG
jgi:GH24 family phage-related lysozyme (muramidase)